jgi:hypothetical protein
MDGTAVEREEKADTTIRMFVAVVDRSVVAARPKYDIFSFIIYRPTEEYTSTQ